jgi:uncharacterized protein
MGVNPFSVNIIGLGYKAHSFDFQFGDEFFAKYGKELISGGKFNAQVVLIKHETFIEAEFKITGQATLVCDRSLDPFDFPIAIDKKMVFKYGEEEKELSDEIFLITHETANIDLGQFVYEFIALEIPMRKIHPRFQEDEETETEGKIVYSSSTQKDDDDDENIDPRWEELRKLK